MRKIGLLKLMKHVTAGNVSANAIVGTLATASQPAITSVGTLSSLATTGDVNTASDVYRIGGTSVLSGTALGSWVTTSTKTTV